MPTIGNGAGVRGSRVAALIRVRVRRTAADLRAAVDLGGPLALFFVIPNPTVSARHSAPVEIIRDRAPLTRPPGNQCTNRAIRMMIGIGMPRKNKSSERMVSSCNFKNMLIKFGDYVPLPLSQVALNTCSAFP